MPENDGNPENKGIEITPEMAGAGGRALLDALGDRLGPHWPGAEDAAIEIYLAIRSVAEVPSTDRLPASAIPQVVRPGG